MVRRKGVGYVVEAFTAIIVVFVFGAGFFLSQSSPGFSWTEYRTEIAAVDIEKTVLATGDLAELVESGSPGAVQRMYEDLSEGELSASTRVKGSPGAVTSVGVFVPPAKRNSVNFPGGGLAGDPCDGNLSEIRSEAPIRKTNTGGLANKYGVTLYLADSDPNLAGGFNGFTDYDTIYVDNGTRCDFRPSEGPIGFDEKFYWGDRVTPEPGAHYEAQSFSSNKLELYNASLMQELGQAASRNTVRETQMVFDGFNMTEDLDYDVALFHGSVAPSVLASNEAKVDGFLKTGSVVLASDLSKSQFQSNSFLADSRLKWVNLSVTSRGEFSFGPNEIGAEASAFFNSVGCYTCSSPATSTSNKVSSPGEQYIDPATQMITGTGSYDTSDWDNTTKLNPGQLPGEAPMSSCSPDYFSGKVSVPKGISSVQRDVQMTHLGQGGSGCNDIYALNIDLDDDGTIDPGREAEATVEGDEIRIYDRTYRVNYEHSTEELSLDYVGNDSYEYVNYVRRFSDQEIKGFALMPDMVEGGEIGGRDGDTVVVGASALLSAASGKSVSQSNADVSTLSSTISSGFPLSVTTRWSR